MRAAALLLATLGAGALAAPAALAPLADPPWRFAGLPEQTLPKTRFDVVDIDGKRALRVASNGSYGNLVHPVDSAAGTLSWSWRVEQPVAGADLRRKEGDDTALKICVMFELPLAALPFWERQKMALARSLSGENLPAATLCYVQDGAFPPGTVLPNAYTSRLRWWVLRAPSATWHSETRDLKADFVRAFGDDSQTVPRLTAVVVGADTDNTGGQALGDIADVRLEP